jgi:hypothetical protein
VDAACRHLQRGDYICEQKCQSFAPFHIFPQESTFTSFLEVELISRSCLPSHYLRQKPDLVASIIDAFSTFIADAHIRPCDIASEHDYSLLQDHAALRSQNTKLEPLL